MAAEELQDITLVDETRLNVTSLLQKPIGSSRELDVQLSSLKIDEELVAREIAATARITRLKAQLLVDARIYATIELACATCLKDYQQEIAETFSEQFRQTVDVRTGAELKEFGQDEAGQPLEDEPGFTIDDNHQLDLEEALRQWIVLAIPIKPSCGQDCPGPLLRSTGDNDDVDERLAGLASLLEEETNAPEAQM